MRKSEEITKDKTTLIKDNKDDVKILTSCPSCLQGLSRYGDETGTDADYIVVEIAKNNLGANWLQEYVERQTTEVLEGFIITS